MPIRQSRLDQEEANFAADLASASAASLDVRRTQIWIPRSKGEWQVYRRQKDLEEMAAAKAADERDEGVPKQATVKNEQDGADKSIRSSEADQSGTTDTEKSGPEDQSCAPHPCCILPTIEDRIKEMQMGTTPIMHWEEDEDGDTWVFIDPPAKQPEQTEYMYQRCIEYYGKPLVMSSTTLKALRSEFFEELLKPSYQFRIIRRRDLKGSLPRGIKYVIDLTPPAEGDDAALFMTELWCVEELRQWSQASARWQVSETLVGGQDEFTIAAVSSDNQCAIPEFSPIRHRNSIVRVMNAVHGVDPDLDSAVKVYTAATVARFFGITQSPLTDYIIRWIRAPPNSLFIEALPEMALKIGDSLQNYDLIRDSFAILVGEDALASATGELNASCTVYGRTKHDIPELYKSRIEYASRSFADRVTHIFEDLVKDDMKWMETLPEFKKLMENCDESLTAVVAQTKAELKAFIRGHIFTVLYCNLDDAPQPDLGSEGGDCLYPRTTQASLWNTLDVAERVMTVTFWRALMNSGFESEFHWSTNLKSWPRRFAKKPQIGLGSRINGWAPELSEVRGRSMRRKHSLKEVHYGDLLDLIKRCRNRRSSLANSSGEGPQQPIDLKPVTEPSGLANQQAPPPMSLSAVPQALKLFWSSDPTPPSQPYADTDLKEPTAYPTSTEQGSGHPVDTKSASGIDFELDKFYHDVKVYLDALCRKMLDPPDVDRTEPMYQAMTPTLLCLDDSEWKYLPLYAGGCDDGSGGTFNDDVPPADTGFSTAGPRIHTGTGSSTASSEFDFVGRQDLESTHHTSTVVNDGFSDQMDRRRVYDDGDSLWDAVTRHKDDSGSATASHLETGTMAAPSTVDAESEDGFMLPMRPKNPEAGIHDLADSMQTTRIDKGKAKAVPEGEDYSDLFVESGGEESDSDDTINEDYDMDDTATEKAEDDTNVDDPTETSHGDSEDEDMVFV
ncbi:MAG: hypothetical protein Q9181_007623 [Wetmoreana brouardii]